MKSKAILAFILLSLSVLFAQKANINCYWNYNTDYYEGNIVLYKGIRYIADYNHRNISPDSVDNDEIGAWSVLYHKIEERSYEGSEKQRALQSSHWEISEMLCDDPFVAYYLKTYLGRNTHYRNVGGSQESDGKDDDNHDSWEKFMVKKDCKFLVERLKRNSTYYRAYLGYKDDMRQIIHNIGDAGVAFSHALNNYSGKSNHDMREAAHEHAIKKYINGPISDKKHREDLMATYFTGSIYDAIDEYERKVRVAIEWANQTGLR
jgi:hypothetical protein